MVVEDMGAATTMEEDMGTATTGVAWTWSLVVHFGDRRGIILITILNLIMLPTTLTPMPL